MPTTAVSLGQMVDLALGTPELGAVNFNVLHSLLHAVLQRLDIADVKADLPLGEDGELAYSGQDSGSRVDNGNRRDLSDLESDSGVTGLTSASEIGVDHGKSAGKSSGERKDTGKSIPVGKMPYHQLEDKVERLERQMAELNALPSTHELMEMISSASAPSGTGDERSSQKGLRPVAEMWQAMQLSRKVDANTQGVSKLMSLVEDLMMGMQQLKEANEELKRAALENDKLVEIMNKLQELEKLMNDFDNRINNIHVPSEEFYDGFVTWSALEDALKGLKDSIASNEPVPVVVSDSPVPVATHSDQPVPDVSISKPVESRTSDSKASISKADTVTIHRIVVESGNQTDSISRPTSRHQSRASTPGPSAQLQDLLERLGRLSDQHDELEIRVDYLENELKNKASFEDLKDLGVSKELEENLTSLMQDLKNLTDAQGQDRASLERLRKTVQQMQSDFDRLNKAIQRLSEDLLNQRNDCERLSNTCKDLEERKADKEFVLNAINLKADKDHLESKVNRSQFDTTYDEINAMINEILNRLLGTEGEWRDALGHLSSEMESKMDRLEFGPFRDELERQLRALASKLSALQKAGHGLSDDEAAGIRKQLIQRFHCISCDKPVDMTPRQPVASLPGQPGLPENKSLRPYIVYDLDQIRQFARSHGEGISDMYSTNRACGGSHTLTFPQRRITKLQRVRDDQLLREPMYSAKARPANNANKLPNVHSQLSKSATYERTGSARRQVSAHSPHPPPASMSDQPPFTPRSASAKPATPPRATINNRSATASPCNRTPPGVWTDESTTRNRGQEVTVQLPQITIEERHSFTDDMTSARDVKHVPPPSEDGRHDADETTTRFDEGVPELDTNGYDDQMEYHEENPRSTNDEEMIFQENNADVITDSAAEDCLPPIDITE